MTRIEPAAVRYDLEVTREAAPRYAETPTPSITEANAMKDSGSVIGNLYVHAATGVAPAAVRPASR